MLIVRFQIVGTQFRQFDGDAVFGFWGGLRVLRGGRGVRAGVGEGLREGGVRFFGWF